MLYIEIKNYSLDINRPKRMDVWKTVPDMYSLYSRTNWNKDFPLDTNKVIISLTITLWITTDIKN